MWRIKRRRTKPKTEGNKVIYPKLNATAKPNRYQSRNTYLDVKCNKELGAGCTDVGCQNTIDACGNFYSCKTAPYRNPILGYRKHLICCYNKSLWPTSFDLYISNTLYASGNIGRWTIVPELWVRPSIASLPNTPYNPVYKGPNDSTGNPIYMTFGYAGIGVGPYPASTRQWNIFNSINSKTGLEWLIIFDTAQAYNPSSSYRFTNMPNALSSNFTTVESLNLPSYPSTQDKENNLIKNIFTVTNNNSGGTNTISNLSFLSFEGKTSKDVSGNVYKDNYAKTCATHPEACYNQVIRTKQNKNGCVDESYNYTTNQYLNRRCLKFQQQEFNFQSQIPVDASGCCSKFKSCNNCQYKTNGDCDCSANGFCTGINKLPCETKNTKCYAIYKRSNPKFKKQGAVSGGSRINRLKYQTRMKAQGRTVNGRNNVINGRRPATLYRTSKPLTLRDNTCVNPPPPPSDLSYETLSGSIIVTWRAGDISKLCRIAPLTGFTIQRTGSPFGHTEPVFGNTYTYSNLPIGSYDIRVRADSYYGSSDWAYLYNIIMSAIPSQILNLTGSVGNQQVQLSWSAPFDGGSPITSYEYKKNNDPWISTGVLSPTSVTIANLTNGTPYTFKVRAVNINGNGPESNSVSLTPANVPDAPTNLTGIAGAQQVDLSWAAPSNQGGAPITNYKYNVNGGTYISIGSTNTTHNVPNLINGTPYTFKVRAVNSIGDGNESNSISVTPIDVPAAPTALTGTAGAEQVSLSWTAPFDNGSSITDYKYKKNNDPFISTGSTATILDVSGLTNGTSYTFKVLAVNAVGDGPDSNSVSLTPTAVPGAPTNLTGTVEEEQVQLSWTAPSNTGGLPITGYKYNINGGTYISTGSLDPSTNVPNLTIGTSYTFKVRVVNDNGDGPESSPLTLTTKLFPPYDLGGSASGTTNQSILTWKEPASLPSLATGENITYDIWVKNIDPRYNNGNGPTVQFLGTTAEYPTTFWSLFAIQLASSGVNASGSLTVGNLTTYTPCAFGPSPQPPNGPQPEGQYYFIIRTRKNIIASNQEIASSDYVSSGPILATGVTPGSCPP